MGLFSRKKKSQGNIHMRGFPGHADTCKCLYMAAEKGISLDVELIDMLGDEEHSPAFRALSPFGKVPCLGEGDFVISGVAAILPYLDVRGGGQPLSPRKAARLGEQNYWIEIGQYKLLPAINVLLDELVLKPIAVSEHVVDSQAVENAKRKIAKVLDVLDKTLEGKEFIVGSFSFAEIHWIPYLHLIQVAGQGQLIDDRPSLKSWFEKMKSRKSGSRTPYQALPSLEQIQGKELKYVA